jgi:hypothetical protein
MSRQPHVKSPVPQRAGFFIISGVSIHSKRRERRGPNTAPSSWTRAKCLSVSARLNRRMGRAPLAPRRGAPSLKKMIPEPTTTPAGSRVVQPSRQRSIGASGHASNDGWTIPYRRQCCEMSRAAGHLWSTPFCWVPAKRDGRTAGRSCPWIRFDRIADPTSPLAGISNPWASVRHIGHFRCASLACTTFAAATCIEQYHCSKTAMMLL